MVLCPEKIQIKEAMNTFTPKSNPSKLASKWDRNSKNYDIIKA